MMTRPQASGNNLEKGKGVIVLAMVNRGSARRKHVIPKGAGLIWTDLNSVQSIALMRFYQEQSILVDVSTSEVQIEQ
jgi:hypothetical protein